MRKQHDQSERDRLFQDLVNLHRSLSSPEEAPAPVPAPPPDAPAPDEPLSSYELLFEHLPMGALLADVVRDRYRHPREYRIRRVNRYYADLLARDRLSLIQSPFFEVLPGGRADWEAELASVALKGRVAQGVSLGPPPAGLLKVTLFLPRRDTLAVLLDPAAATAEPGLFRESARHRPLQAEQMLGMLPVWMVRVLPDGRPTYFNAAALNRFGDPAAPPDGTDEAQAVADAVRTMLQDRLSTLSPGNPVIRWDLPVERSGIPCWEHWTATGEFNAKDDLVACVCAGFDITDRQQALRRERRTSGLMRDLLAYLAECRRGQVTETSLSVGDMQRLQDENIELRERVRRLDGQVIQGPLGICGRCSRIHDAEGHWMLPHLYFELHTAATVTSKTCPYCRNVSRKAMESDEREPS